MSKNFSYCIYIIVLVAIALSSCGKKLNKRVTLWRNDKIPYGTFYAYDNLGYIFTDAIIETNDHSPVTFYDDDDNPSAYIVVGRMIRPDEKELKAILNHAIAGNHVFISALDIGQNLLDTFKLEATSFTTIPFIDDSLTVSITDPDSRRRLNFSYPGLRLDNHFTKLDSSVTKILGRNSEGKANYVKFTYQGGGAVFIHLAPGALTNFFLLHKENKRYYDLVLSSIPDTLGYVRWDDYYRHHVDGKDLASRSAFSKLGTFLQNEVLRWAFWLAIILFAIIYLFESKRKQRVVPPLKQLDNTSLDFVKTVGRLYYQRKDNKNLASKISTHFLSYIRTRYNLQTSNLNKDFAERLAFKSGYPITLVNEILDEVRTIESAYELTDDELLAFNNKIDKFINKS